MALKALENLSPRVTWMLKNIIKQEAYKATVKETPEKFYITLDLLVR